MSNVNRTARPPPPFPPDGNNNNDDNNNNQASPPDVPDDLSGPSGGSGEKAPPGWNSNRTLFVPQAPKVPERPFGDKLIRRLFWDSDTQWGPALPFILAAEKDNRQLWSIESMQKKIHVIEEQEERERQKAVEAQKQAYKEAQKQAKNKTAPTAPQVIAPPAPVPSANGGANETQPDTPFPVNMSSELEKDNRPARIDFVSWMGFSEHVGDFDDEFYSNHWENLYTKTVDFAARWFDLSVDLEPVFGAKVWDLPLTVQFKEYAGLVAHEDKLRGGWPAILNHPRPRRWLVTGILSQIMEKKIFNELLFGATPAYKDELDRLDSKFIDREGYSRKFARIGLVELALERSYVPAHFWPEVDQLATQAAMVFLPLLNVFKECKGTNDAFYRQEVFLQELHTILAYAGFIQVCMARSESIFHILSATPGARMDYSIEYQSDIPMYRDSKELAETQEEEWRRRSDEALKVGNVTKIETENKRPGAIQLPRDQVARRQMEHARLRGAKVKFAVFPKLTRYQPHNKGKGIPPDNQDHPASRDLQEDDIEGQRMVHISECMVVYYQGLIYPTNIADDGVPLDTHLQNFPPRPEGLLVALVKFLWRCYYWTIWPGGIPLGLTLLSNALCYFTGNPVFGIWQDWPPVIAIYFYSILPMLVPTEILLVCIAHGLKLVVSAQSLRTFEKLGHDFMEYAFGRTAMVEPGLQWLWPLAKLCGFISWALEAIIKSIWAQLP
ncbi:hypothetical protein F5B20DRAFT_336435 [Whalleya microplaca]|nr:hypothetical protein F5B20DRAFT_336435 [Whalleya microplaca]